jgi:hypothetical protein
MLDLEFEGDDGIGKMRYSRRLDHFNGTTNRGARPLSPPWLRRCTREPETVPV